MIGFHKRKLSKESWIAATLLLLAFFLPEFETAAQEPETPAPSLKIVQVNQSQQLSITLAVDVLSESNVPIPGLTTENFTLTGVNAADFQITDAAIVTSNEVPLATILVVDASETMSGSAVEWAKNAMSEYIAAMGVNDSVAIVSFSTEAALLQDFTSDKELLTEVVDSIDTQGTGTALHEVATFSIAHMENAPVDARQAIILISDGVDLDDTDAAVLETLDFVENSQVPLFSIGIGADIDRDSLEDLADRTGTTYFEPGTEASTAEVYTDILQIMRQQYRVNLFMAAPQSGTTYSVGLQAIAAGTTISNLESIVVSIPALVAEVASIALETPGGAAFTPTPGPDDQPTQSPTPLSMTLTPSPTPSEEGTEDTVRVTVVSTIQRLSSERDQALATINAIGVAAGATLSEDLVAQTQTSIVLQQTMTFTPSVSETPTQSSNLLPGSGENSPTPIETLRVVENAAAAPHRPERAAVRDRAILLVVFIGLLIFLAASFVHHQRTHIESKYKK
jgi:VWFA-related protein